MVRDIPQTSQREAWYGNFTDDILILGDNEFVKQGVELKGAKLLAKPSE